MLRSKIVEIIETSLAGVMKYEVTDITSKDDIYYIMISTAAAPHRNLSEQLETRISNQLKINGRICFIQEKKMASKDISKAKRKIEGVKRVIAVCSGKGGVGKSTISSSIAFNLAAMGYKVGLLDADIYGPSIQKIFELNDEVKIKDNHFIPHEKYGVKLMSMGFLVRSSDALVWRGPMISKNLHNLIQNTEWHDKNILGIKSELDFLVIDTPPGTGDIHLTLAENYIVDGVVIVSTPQEVAVTNAHRSVDMMRKLKIKVLGIIENMAYLLSEDNSKHFIFGTGNVTPYAASEKLHFLGAVPLMPALSDTSNVGFLKCKEILEISEILVKLLDLNP